MASERDDPVTDSEMEDKSEKKIHTSNNKSAYIVTPNPSFYLSSSDNPGTSLVVVLLNGDNYRTWARSMRTTLRAKTKLGFIDGSIKRPTSHKADYQNWEKADSMVMAWIINSTNPSLHGRTINVTEFYTKFKTLVDELNEQQPLPECTCGASKEMNQREEDRRVHLFLGSLDNERFAHVKANILNIDPLPSLWRTFNHILREEARFTAEKERNIKTESGSAFYSFSTNKQKRRDGHKPRCDHCGKVGHVKSKCFELVGYPPNWNTRRPQRGPNRTGGQPTTHLAQVNESHKKADNTKDIIMGHALCGTYVKRNTEQHETIVGNDKTFEDQQWVLDSGASHHMTPLFSLLKGVRNLEKPFYIIVPTGNTVLVEKMGTGPRRE
ncbi:Zinc finger, CCHC-type [Sesbania bispinosa]|nr:Zinc finger, CCHC-type [Sesbania bispinosa]